MANFVVEKLKQFIKPKPDTTPKTYENNSYKIKLKPCPFCGAPAYIASTGDYYPGEKRYKVMTNCNCCIQPNFFLSPQNAAYRWNRRVKVK